MSELSNIVDLFKQLRDDTTALVREEVALVKTELTEKASTASRNIAFLAAGALVGYSALILILLALAFILREFLTGRGLSVGSATSISLLIVGTVVGIISAILVAKALSALKAGSMAPRRTIETLKEDKQWAQSKVS